MGVTVLGIQHNFYPRSPCGERQRLGLLGWLRVLISIHALLAESDRWAWMGGLSYDDFYPRSPCGERRYLINTYHRIFGISIHALLAESDLPRNADCNYRSISIHALLAESDDYFSGVMRQNPGISIHALLAESDAHLIHARNF